MRRLAALLLVALAGCGEARQQAPSASVPPPPKPAQVGQPITQDGGNGLTLEITLKSYGQIQPAYPVARPAQGNEYIAAQIAVRNVGTASYNGQLGFTITLADGRQIDPVVLDDPDCAGFESVALPPGRTGKGCVPFEVPGSGVLKSLLGATEISGDVLEWDL